MHCGPSYQLVAGTVTHKKDVDSVITDGKQNPMLVAFIPAVHRLAYVFGESIVLGR